MSCPLSVPFLEVAGDHGRPIRAWRAWTAPVAGGGLQSSRAQFPASGLWALTCVSLLTGVYLGGGEGGAFLCLWLP